MFLAFFLARRSRVQANPVSGFAFDDSWDDVVVVVAATDDGTGDGDIPANMMPLPMAVVVMVLVTMRLHTGNGGKRRGRTEDCEDAAGSLRERALRANSLHAPCRSSP